MQTFDEWYETNHGSDKSIIRAYKRQAWHAALDQVEGLADEFKRPITCAETDFNEGVSHTMTHCAAALSLRIKELRK